jgi:hypothetical protein
MPGKVIADKQAPPATAGFVSCPWIAIVYFQDAFIDIWLLQMSDMTVVALTACQHLIDDQTTSITWAGRGHAAQIAVVSAQ